MKWNFTLSKYTQTHFTIRSVMLDGSGSMCKTIGELIYCQRIAKPNKIFKSLYPPSSFPSILSLLYFKSCMKPMDQYNEWMSEWNEEQKNWEVRKCFCAFLIVVVGHAESW